jgi:Polyketide cyclase / dehydrase and lipid transport
LPRIRLRTVINASPRRVWADISDLTSHVEWMADAESIRFVSAITSGIGTEFVCDTKIGPLRLRDRMTVTEWVPGHSLGIRHRGVVAGEGRFMLKRRTRGGTKFVWEERLDFPWWLGGPLGVVMARPILKRVWRRNLATLATRF